MTAAPVQCAILVGGRGSRLGALTETVPKPLLEVAGRPFLHHLLDRILAQGKTRILLLAGYLGERFAPTAAEYSTRCEIDCLVEAQALGTAGALLHARARLDENFLLLNGDTLFDIPLDALARMDAPEPWLGRIALRKLADGSRSGAVEFDGSRIRAFRERGHAGPALVNGGVYLLRRAVLDRIEAGQNSLERDLFPALAKAGLLQGIALEGYFVDIGVPADLARADKELG